MLGRVSNAFSQQPATSAAADTSVHLWQDSHSGSTGLGGHAVHVIDDVVQRIEGQLPPKPGEGRKEQLAVDAETLVELSRTARELNYIIQRVLRLLEDVMIGSAEDINAAHQDQVHSDRFVLELLGRCLRQHRKSDPSHPAQALPSEIVEQLFCALLQGFLRAGSGFMTVDLAVCTKAIVYEISTLSFQATFAALSRRFQLLTLTKYHNEHLGAVQVISCLNLDLHQLDDLMGILAQHAPKYKTNVLKLLGPPLRTAIWNCMHKYPLEFRDLYLSDKGWPSLAKSASVLFTQFERQCSKDKRRNLLWPAMSTLLLLDPVNFRESDNVATAPRARKASVITTVTATVTGSQSIPQQYYRFISRIRENLVARAPLCDIAVLCCIDHCTAVSWIEEPRYSGPYLAVAPALKTLIELMLHPARPYTTVSGKYDVDMQVKFMTFLMRGPLPDSIAKDWALGSLLDTAPCPPPAVRAAAVSSVSDSAIGGVSKSVSTGYTVSSSSSSELLSGGSSGRGETDPHALSEWPHPVHPVLHLVAIKTMTKAADAHVIGNAIVTHAALGMAERVLARHVNALFQGYLRPGLMALVHSPTSPSTIGRGKRANVDVATMALSDGPFTHAKSILHACVKLLRRLPSLALGSSNASQTMDVNGQDGDAVAGGNPGDGHFMLDRVSRDDDPRGTLEHTLSIMQSLCEVADAATLVSDSSSAHKLCVSASKTLQTLCEPHNVVMWCAGDPDRGFWEVTTLLYAKIHPLCLRKRLSTSTLHRLVDLMIGITKCGNQYLGGRPQGSQDRLDPILWTKRANALNNFEVTLIVLLCSGQYSDLGPRVAELCAAICSQLELLGPLERQDHTIDANFDFYRSVSGFDSGAREQVRSKFRIMTRRSEVLVKAWRKVYERWRLCQDSVLTASGKSEGRQDVEQAGKLSEFDNYTCFLCSLAAVCFPRVADKQITGGGAGGTAPGSMAISLANMGNLSGTASDRPATNESRVVLDDFLQDCLNLLEQPTQSVREMVKRDLGNYLNPALFSSLLALIVKSTNLGEGDKTKISPSTQRSNFVESVIGILKSLIGHLDRALDPSTMKLFETTLLLLMEYASHILDPANIAGIRLKKEFCELIVFIVDRSEVIQFADSRQLETTLLKTVADWSAAQSKDADFNMAALQVIARLLKLLPFQVTDSNGEQMSETRRGQIFSRYFNFLAAALTRLHDGGADAVGTVLSKQGARLEENAVAGLSSLLNMNLGTGLDMVIRYALHVNPRLRRAFLRVLQRFLLEREDNEMPQRAKPRHPDDALLIRYGPLFSLLLDREMALVVAICDTIDLLDADAVASTLVHLFNVHGQALHLIKLTVSREVGRTQYAATLFRSNSMASRLMKVQGQIVGAAYLRRVLGPPITALCAVSDPTWLEVDPNRIPRNSDGSADNASDTMARRSSALELQTGLFLDALSASIRQLPASLRILCRHMRTAVKEKHPGAENLAVGGFVFLRFVCPAIITPEFLGIIDAPPKEFHRRALILVTKVLQNLASGLTTFKEQYMSGLEPLLVARQRQVLEILEAACEVNGEEEQGLQIGQQAATSDDDNNETNRDAEDRQHAELSTDATAALEDMCRMHHPRPGRDGRSCDSAGLGYEEAIVLHRYLHVRQDVVAESLRSTSSTATTGGIGEQFCEIVEALGPPPEKSNSQSSNNRSFQLSAPRGDEESSLTNWDAFEEYIKANRSRSTTAIEDKKVFYQHGVSLEGFPVFYYIARRREMLPTSETELLVLSIVRALSNVFQGPFDIVVDCAFFNRSHEIPMEVIKYLPTCARDNAKRLFVVLPNSAVKDVANRTSFIFTFQSQFRRMKKMFTPISTPSQLKNFIAESEIGLPQATIDLELDVQTTFARLHNEKGDEVTMKVGSSGVHITLANASILGETTLVTNIIALSSLRETTVIKDKIVEITHRSGLGLTDRGQLDRALKLKTNSAQDAQLIRRTLVNIVSMQRIETASAQARDVRLADVAVATINVAFINMCHRDAAVRCAGYDLLCQLSTSGGYNIQGLYRPGIQEAFTPTHFTHVVARISTIVAKAEPHLSLDFLQCCFQHFSGLEPYLKHACIEFSLPWLHNLCEMGATDETRQEATRALLDYMLELALVEYDMAQSNTDAASTGIFYLLLHRAFPILMECKTVAPTMLQGLFHRLRNVNEGRAVAIADLVVAVRMFQPELSSGAIVGKLLDLVKELLTLPFDPTVVAGGTSNGEPESKQSAATTKALHLWNQISIYSHLLKVVSFDNVPLVTNHMPDILHLTCMLGTFGSRGLRGKLYSALLNVVATLEHIIPKYCKDEDTHLHVDKLSAEVTRSEFRLVFLEERSMYDQEFSSVTSSSPDVTMSELTCPLIVNRVETIADSLVKFTQVASTIAPEFAMEWRQRFERFTRDACFNYQSVFRARSFVTLGCSCYCDSMTDPAFLSTLRSLKLEVQTSDFGCGEVVMSILVGLSRMTRTLRHGQALVWYLMWLGIALLQIGNSDLFSLALRLLLSVLESPALPKGIDIEANLIHTRNVSPALDEALSGLEKACGVCFQGDEQSVAFAIVAGLVKGLAHPMTKSVSKKLLIKLLDMSFLSHGYHNGSVQQVEVGEAHPQSDNSTEQTPRTSLHTDPRGSVSGVGSGDASCARAHENISSLRRLTYLATAWPILSGSEIADRIHRTTTDVDLPKKDRERALAALAALSLRGGSTLDANEEAAVADTLHAVLDCHGFFTLRSATLLAGIMMCYAYNTRSSTESVRLYSLLHACLKHHPSEFSLFFEPFAGKLREEYGDRGHENMAVLVAIRNALHVTFSVQVPRGVATENITTAPPSSQLHESSRLQGQSGDASRAALSDLGFNVLSSPQRIDFAHQSEADNRILWRHAYTVLQVAVESIVDALNATSDVIAHHVTPIDGTQSKNVDLADAAVERVERAGASVTSGCGRSDVDVIDNASVTEDRGGHNIAPIDDVDVVAVHGDTFVSADGSALDINQGQPDGQSEQLHGKEEEEIDCGDAASF